jgi:hypothetical protein
MRADIHDGPEHNTLQPEAGYIDASPLEVSLRAMIAERLYGFGGRSLNVRKCQIHAQPSQIEAHICDVLDRATPLSDCEPMDGDLAASGRNR